MNKALSTYGLALVMSVALIGMPACAKKSVQSGGDSQSTQGTAKGGKIVRSPVSAIFRTPGFSRRVAGFGALTGTPQKSVWAVVR